MLNQRRALLVYLRRTDFESFCYVIHKLGLKDNNYARQVRLYTRTHMCVGASVCVRASVCVACVC
jgi:hypothetical protein